MQVNPRLKVEVDGAISPGDDGGAAGLLELGLQDVIAAQSLGLVSRECVVVLDWMMQSVCIASWSALGGIILLADFFFSPEPVALATEWRQGRDEEVLPFVKVDSVLFSVASGTHLVLWVVVAEDVVHDRTRLPRDDSIVGVFKGRDSTVLVDLQESLALDSLFRVIAAFPDFDLVGNLKIFQSNGNLDWIGPVVMGVKKERFHSRTHV